MNERTFFLRRSDALPRGITLAGCARKGGGGVLRREPGEGRHGSHEHDQHLEEDVPTAQGIPRQ